jgi:hypothetical protein
MLTAGTSYSLVSHFVHMRATTAVATTRPEVGVLVDAPCRELPALATALSASGMHASFAVNRVPSASQLSAVRYGDQALPRLPNGGLVRWLGARGQLHRLVSPMGYGRHFLYSSSGPSVGQWLMAHGAGGRLVAGAVHLSDRDDAIGHLRAGELIELRAASAAQLLPLLARLRGQLRTQHLRAVPIGRLMHDAGVSV